MNQSDSDKMQNRNRRKIDPLPTHEVYFVKAETIGLIKIGYAVSSADRLRTLQVGSPDKLSLIGKIACHNAAELEGELHRRFKALRSHGEWFRPNDELLAYIASASAESVTASRSALRTALQRAAA